MREKPPAVTMNSTQPNPGSLEDRYMRLLAECLAGIGYVHRRKLKRKRGHWYRMTVEYQWAAEGVIDVERLTVREIRDPR